MRIAGEYNDDDDVFFTNEGIWNMKTKYTGMLLKDQIVK
jgi:hypothetical protein